MAIIFYASELLIAGVIVHRMGDPYSIFRLPSELVCTVFQLPGMLRASPSVMAPILTTRVANPGNTKLTHGQ